MLKHLDMMSGPEEHKDLGESAGEDEGLPSDCFTLMPHETVFSPQPILAPVSDVARLFA